jgi:hypothetical protein
VNGLRWQRVPLHAVPWQQLDLLEDRVLFQTREWLAFLQQTQRVEPVVAVLRAGEQDLGWFSGGLGTRFGVRVLGSAMPGWTTQYMGFNLREGVSRRAALDALVPFAFGDLRCAHLEVSDRSFCAADLAGTGLSHDPIRTFTADLSSDEATILSRMTPGTRQNMRKAQRLGVTVEEASPAGFAAEYFAQLQDVFAKQRLVPTYGVDRVQALIDNVYPTGRLQLLRVRAPDGLSIATALVAGHGGAAYFWGGASWRDHQRMRPNEVLFWHAFRTWKARGASEFDFGGGGEYKRKYGAQEIFVPQVRASRWRVLDAARGAARKGVRVRQQAVGALKARADA